MAAMRECSWLALAGGGTRIALTGAGGKTSLMETLAFAFARQGHSVIRTTTTRIYPPDNPRIGPLAGEKPILLNGLSSRDCSSFLQRELDALPPGRRRIVLARALDETSGKLSGLTGEDLRAIARDLPHVVFLIEADGAAGLPLKAHAEYEPCIPACADRIIAVAGLDGAGKPWADAVHRPETGLARAEGGPPFPVGGDIQHRRVTPRDIAALLLHPHGAFRGAEGGRAVFLNKLDLLPDLAPALETAEAIRTLAPGIPCFAGSLQRGYCRKLG